jgi:hypothetical protein
MHKDDKFYTFLLSHSTKSKIYIRPVQIRKKSVHTGIASLVLIIGIFSIGFSGFIKDNLLTKLDTKNSNDSALLTQQINFLRKQSESRIQII